MGCLSPGRRRAARAVALGLAALGIACASSPKTGGYEVRRGDTLYSIALRHGVSVTDLMVRNGVKDPTELMVGTRLVIPDTTRRDRKRVALPPSVLAPVAPAPNPPGELRFSWPVRGRITSRFGKRHGRMHEGIDVAAPRGSLVRAAESGRVSFAGKLGDYGKLVIVRHGRRLVSVYAHNRKLRVKRGDFVDRGQVVAEVGSSGNATGPHLHFEIRNDDRPQDPLRYLP